MCICSFASVLWNVLLSLEDEDLSVHSRARDTCGYQNVRYDNTLRQPTHIVSLASSRYSYIPVFVHTHAPQTSSSVSIHPYLRTEYTKPSFHPPTNRTVPSTIYSTKNTRIPTDALQPYHPNAPFSVPHP